MPMLPGVRWFKPANSSDTIYAAGWSSGIQLDLVASKFLAAGVTTKTALGNDAVVSPAVNGHIEFTQTGLTEVLGNQLTLSRSASGVTMIRVLGAPAGEVAAPGLNLNIGSGGNIGGSFMLPGSSLPLKIRGVVLQKVRRGAGLLFGNT